MFSEQFFDLLLDFGDNWKVERVYANIRTEEVDIFGISHKCSSNYENKKHHLFLNSTSGCSRSLSGNAMRFP